VAVSAVGTISVRQNLVQVNDLDPELLIVMDASVAGDGGGGISSISATIPTGFAAMIIRASNTVLGAGTATDCVYTVSVDGVLVDEAGVGPRVVGTNQRYPNFLPAQVLWIQNSIVVNCDCDNINTQTQVFETVMYLWDLRTARNLPQRFFWPGTLA